MITGINVYETWWFVSEHDPDKDNPTKFELGCIDAIVNSYINDKTASYDSQGGLKINVAERNILMLKFGLKGLENFIDPRTKLPMKFETVSTPVRGKNYNTACDEIIKMLDENIINELVIEIQTKNSLSRDESKN